VKRHALVLLVVATSLAGRAAAAEPADALKAATAAASYAFKVEQQSGAPGAVEAKYQKGQPLWCKADNIELFKKGDALVYRDGDKWMRSKRGITSDPLRVLGAVARASTLRLPHEELAAVAKGVKGGWKAAGKEDGCTVYAADLTPEAARQLAPTAQQSVARGGTARLCINSDGKLVKYTLAIRLEGRLGNADVDGTAPRTVTLSGVGSTRVEVPVAARKALE